MYVNVAVAPRTLAGASVVPVQAVQTGPDNRFVFVVGEDRKVAAKIVTVPYLDTGFAVVEGVEPGAKVVLEGAQNLRSGSLVSVGDGSGGKGEGKGKGGGAKPGKGEGAPAAKAPT
jgi:multidrug efflux pump subunit AcrA (membrane-fusion protein)